MYQELYMLALEYRETSNCLRARIKELEGQANDGYPVQGRIRTLQSMYKDVREIIRLIEGHYFGRNSNYHLPPGVDMYNPYNKGKKGVRKK